GGQLDLSPRLPLRSARSAPVPPPGGRPVIDLLALLGSLSVQLFAVASMAAVGMRYELREILTPLRNAPGVVLALIANFVAVPALAYAVTRLVALERPFEIGLILVTLAAGAPFVVKLTQLACGTVAFSS